MEKDVPDTKHTQQDNVSFTKTSRLTALTTASDQPWISSCSLNMSSCLGGLSLHLWVLYDAT